MNATHQQALGLVEQGEHTKARSLFIEALTDEETDVQVIFDAARALDTSGCDDEAIEAYKRILDQGYYPSAMLNLGMLYEDQENYLEALKCFEETLDRDPENELARKLHGDVVSALGSNYESDELSTQEMEALKREYETQIDSLFLSVRTTNSLKSFGLNTLYDLTLVDSMDLLLLRNFGKTQLEELQEALSDRRVKLGMNMTEKFNAKKERMRAAQDLIEDYPDGAKLLDSMSIPLRLKNAFRLLGIDSVAELSCMTTKDLSRFKSFGKLSEIRKILDQHGLSLRAEMEMI